MKQFFNKYQDKAIAASRTYLEHKQYKVLDVCQIHNYTDRTVDPYITAIKDGELYLFWVGIQTDDIPEEPERRIFERVSAEIMNDVNSEYRKYLDGELEKRAQVSHRFGTLCFRVISEDRALLRCRVWD